MALSKQKQVGELNKIKNTSAMGSTKKKRVSSERPQNTRLKRVKLSDELEKSICTTSKKEESLLGKVKLMIGEQINILNDSFNQKIQSLNTRVEQIQCKGNHEEIAKSFLKKISKLEGHINAVIAFQKKMDSKPAVPQKMVPCTNQQNGVLNQFGPSVIYPAIINIPRPSNTLLLSSYIGFPSQHVPQYVRTADGVLVVSTGNQYSTIATNSEIFIKQTDFKPSMP